MLALPEYYESEIESITREAISGALGDMGRAVTADAEATPYRVAYSVDWDRGGKKGLPQSSLRLEPENAWRDADPATVALHEPDSGVRPGIAIGPKLEKKSDAPSVRVTIYLLKDGARIWSGFGDAELNGRRPSEAARQLTGALMAHWGVSASYDDAAFLDPAQ
ncbi:MAG: hypothetical protein R3C58_05205 [Parvularculaceae bacterium]